MKKSVHILNVLVICFETLKPYSHSHNRCHTSIPSIQLRAVSLRLLSGFMATFLFIMIVFLISLLATRLEVFNFIGNGLASLVAMTVAPAI